MEFALTGSGCWKNMFTAFLLTSIFPLSRISFRGSHYHPLPDPVTITLPGKDFQPRKADMEREYDMPGRTWRRCAGHSSGPLMWSAKTPTDTG